MTHISTPIERIAVFPGSFNPFTIGHADIVARGLELFDRIVIAVGINPSKPGNHSDAVGAIRKIYTGNPRVSVVLLFSRPELSAISSSIVRELQRFGHDVSNFLPSNNSDKQE